MFAYYNDYIWHDSLLKSNTVWKTALSEYIVFHVIRFLTTVRDGQTSMGERYARVPDSDETGVLVPL